MIYKTSKIVSSIIALLPIIAFVKVPGLSVGLGMFVLILLTPWLIFVNLTRFQLNDVFKFLGLILFCSYSVFCSVGNTQNIVGYILVMIWVMGTYKYLIDENYLFGIMEFVAILASIIVVAQTLCHYVLGFHLISNIPVLLKDDIAAQYFVSIVSGIEESGMYRPSAFFLEPSHFAQYEIVVLLWLLLKSNSKNRMKFALVISIGIVMTSSGMGIAMVVGAWIVYTILGMNLKKRENVVKSMILVAGGFLFVMLCLRLPFFQTAVNRVVVTGNGYNAIDGRLFFWDYYFKPLTSMQFVWGCGYVTELDKYMTGFMMLLYCSGVVGVVLFYAMLIQYIKYGNVFAIILSLFYAVLIIFSGLTATINLIFYLSLISSEKKYLQFTAR